LLFNQVTLGDALAHMHAQQNWAHADSLMSIVRTLWMGNPWNQPSVTLAQRYVFVAFLLFASWGIMRVNRPLGIYSFASAGLMLLQADFGNAFRFGAVLFPALFWFGDWVSQKPRWARWLVALLAVVVNFKVTYAYAVGRWAY